MDSVFSTIRDFKVLTRTAWDLGLRNLLTFFVGKKMEWFNTVQKAAAVSQYYAENYPQYFPESCN